MLLYYAIYFVLGLAIGSFLNVCIHRIPRGESIVLPASRCPHCLRPIRPLDNIPIFSYIWLGGKCRHCKQPISFQYPLVEGVTGLAFFCCALQWDLTAPALLNSVFLAALIVLVFIDYQHQILPNVITLPGALLGIALSGFQDQAYFEDVISFYLSSVLWHANPTALLPWVGSTLGALVGGGVLFGVGSAYHLVRKRPGLGMGDVKMMAMVGAFLGWRLAFLTIFLGSLLGSLAGIFLILFRGRTMQSKLAFGTFLGAGAAAILFFGLPFIRWYTAAR